MAAPTNPSRRPAPPGENTLAVTRPDGRNFTKAQRAFNRNVKRIEQLRRTIVSAKERWEDALARYAVELIPLERELCDERKSHVRRVWELLKTTKGVRATQRRGLHSHLMDVLDAIEDQSDAPLEADLLEIHDSIVTAPENSGEVDGAIDTVRDMIKEQFEEMGVDFDFSRLKPGMSREECQRLFEEAASKIDSADIPDPKADAPRGSRARRAREEREAQKEELRRKDISGLYKRLAKLLHPDLESDPELRTRKESAMKDLTTAYKDNDLHALLRIELEWIENAGNDAARLSDDKLVLYNEVLREQVDELESELECVGMHPRFRALHRYVHPVFGLHYTDMGESAAFLRHTIDELRATNRRLAGNNPRAEFISLARARSY